MQNPGEALTLSEAMRYSENSLALKSDTGFKSRLSSLSAVWPRQVLHLCELQFPLNVKWENSNHLHRLLL